MAQDSSTDAIHALYQGYQCEACQVRAAQAKRELAGGNLIRAIRPEVQEAIGAYNFYGKGPYCFERHRLEISGGDSHPEIILTLDSLSDRQTKKSLEPNDTDAANTAEVRAFFYDRLKWAEDCRLLIRIDARYFRT